METRDRAVTALVVLLALTACDTPRRSIAPPRAPALDFTNGPADLPNVMRGDASFLTTWADATTGLVIVVNAPDAGVSDLRRCGGPLRPDLQPVQTVGDLQDVARQLRLMRDVNLHVYQPAIFTRFEDLCNAPLVAKGTGNVTATDNDVYETGSGANAWGLRAQGLVTLVAGGSAPLSAELQDLVLPDGSFRMLVNRVRLQ